MSGNASFEYSRAALLAVTEVEAPVEVTSQDLDDQLAEVLTRLRLPGSLLERVAGVRSMNPNLVRAPGEQFGLN